MKRRTIIPPPVSTLARIMHEPPTATADTAVLPGVLRSRTLQRTDEYASGSSSSWNDDGTRLKEGRWR